MTDARPIGRFLPDVTVGGVKCNYCVGLCGSRWMIQNVSLMKYCSNMTCK